MKVEEVDGNKARLVLSGMIVHDSVLGKIASKWDKKDGLFASSWENRIANWAVSYYDKYGKAPGKAIVGIFRAWADDNKKDKQTVKAAEAFLEGLSEEWGRLKKAATPEYLADLAGDHFNRVRAERLKEQIEGDLEAGKVEDAFKRIARFEKVEIGQGSLIDVLGDRTMIDEMLAAAQEPALVEYPGDAGRFFGRTFRRSAFVAFMGKAKSGKSFWLIDVAWRAMQQRHKVLVVQIGDMVKEDMAERWTARAAKRPVESQEGWPTTIQIPTGFEEDDEGAWKVSFDERRFKRAPTGDELWEANQRVRKLLKSKIPLLKMAVYSNGSIGMDGVRALVQQCERSGWVPDVLCLDYADLLAPAAGYSESRDAVNANWKGLRKLSQDYHMLVVTGTQANAASFTAESLDMSNFSEDRRKFDHVTAMLGINQTDGDKDVGVTRLNYLVLRKGKFTVKRQVYAAGCLAIANPCIKSRL